MLSEEQKVTKWEAVAETAKYTADKNNALYVAIALESINKDGVVVQEVANNSVAQQDTRPSIISISDLFKKINPSDKSFLKYIPDGFLNEEQKAAKTQALEEDKKQNENAKTLEKAPVKSSLRSTNAISTREMLLDSLAMEDLNGDELRSVTAYRNRIKRINELVERRAAVERERIASKAHYRNIIKKIRQKRDKQLEELKAKHKKQKNKKFEKTFKNLLTNQILCVNIYKRCKAHASVVQW